MNNPSLFFSRRTSYVFWGVLALFILYFGVGYLVRQRYIFLFLYYRDCSRIFQKCTPDLAESIKSLPKDTHTWIVIVTLQLERHFHKTDIISIPRLSGTFSWAVPLASLAKLNQYIFFYHVCMAWKGKQNQLMNIFIKIFLSVKIFFNEI